MGRLPQRDEWVGTSPTAMSVDHRRPAHRLMSIVELAVYLCVCRVLQPIRPRSVRRMLAHWFGGRLTDDDVDEAIRAMLACGWLISKGHSLVANETGSEVAAVLVAGIGHMLHAPIDGGYSAITMCPPCWAEGRESNASNV